MATLQELMALEKPSPKQMELQARYSNAQFAVDLAYRLAKDAWWMNKPGSVEPGKTQDLVDCARALKVEIEKDLNDTLKVLEVKDDGAKSDTPKLS